MSRTKVTKNISGSIFSREIKKDGELITIWDARKRNKNSEGENKEISKMVKKNIVEHSTGDVHQIYQNSNEYLLEDARRKLTLSDEKSLF